MAEGGKLMTTIENDSIMEKLQSAVGNNLVMDQDSFFTRIKVNPADILTLLKALKDQAGMNYLANLTAVDYGEEFEVIYHLYAIPDNQRKFAVKTRVTKQSAQLNSAFSIYPTADWQEREIYDLLGIRFLQHPNLIRVLLPDNFEGHPLRKDYEREANRRV